MRSHIYRYEGDDPGNEAVVYGTESSGKKGRLSQAFLQIQLLKLLKALIQ
jgi:hypothetical protein